MKRTNIGDAIGVFLLTLGNILMVISIYERYAHGNRHNGTMVVGLIMVVLVFVYANVGKDERG